ncbi:MAG: vitamin K epoxide reductase family protein [Candidatus Rokubacteria bacterium]|nr:vitamin K epoxide reductase family protein [Candidatus Rokubacteria bacterium]
MREKGEGRRKRAARVREAATARPAWLVVALCVAGILVAGYLAWLKFAGGHALLCRAGSGCDLVNASRYSALFGVPTALWGLGFYAVIGGLALPGLTAARWRLAFLLAVAGAAFSLYLTGVSIWVIGAACVYCLASTAIALAVVGVLLWQRPPMLGGRAVRGPRLWVPAAVAGVAAIVIGAGLFAWEGAAADAEALARHLVRIDAVMYGAFW